MVEVAYIGDDIMHLGDVNSPVTSPTHKKERKRTTTGMLCLVKQ
jgi:hypothetical protein